MAAVPMDWTPWATAYKGCQPGPTPHAAYQRAQRAGMLNRSTTFKTGLRMQATCDIGMHSKSREGLTSRPPTATAQSRTRHQLALQRFIPQRLVGNDKEPPPFRRAEGPRYRAAMPKFVQAESCRLSPLRPRRRV